MVEPEKPFACTIPDCGMTFTNEDHLNVHTRKHDMVLQFGCGQKEGVYVADQTPTPTRFIRNCEEVGLFQDLQSVNPFDEGFKRAIETKQGMMPSLEHGCTPSEELHTPQMFPLLDPGDSVFSSTNNHRNITISRSSSDETGAVKEFETTRISKLTNEVTTISRIVEKHDDTPKHKETLKNSVSYTNNVIKIHSNVEIRKDTDRVEDIRKDGLISKNSMKDAYDRLQAEVPPMMSQKSIDYVVDSLTTDFATEKAVKDSLVARKDEMQDNIHIKDGSKETSDKLRPYEVILKLPSGQQIKLVGAEEKPVNTKDLLKKVIKEKAETQKIMNSVNVHIPNVIPTITGGTLIPVTIVNTNLVNTNLVSTHLVNTSLTNTNLATTTLSNTNIVNANLVNTNLATGLVNATIVNSNLATNLVNTVPVNAAIVNTNLVRTNLPKMPVRAIDKGPVRRKYPEKVNNNNEHKKSRDMDKEKSVLSDQESKSAASRRYRANLKAKMSAQALENRELKDMNERLIAEKALLQELILDHMKRCHCPDDLRKLKEKMKELQFRKVNDNL